jgi:UDP-2-acetamido-3-amino-2,3-dideoxy-glucuronate N-acetyltransferase
MSRHGHVLKDPGPDGIFICPESGLRYKEAGPGILRCLDLDEDAPLPDGLSVGKGFYREHKRKNRREA